MTDRNYDLRVGTCKTHGPNTPMTKHGLCNIQRLDRRKVNRKYNGPIHIYRSQAKGKVILSPDERAAKIAEFGECALCGKADDLNLDHCHVSGEFRGVLCGPCNRALGTFKDDVDVLAKAIDYLTPHATDGTYMSVREMIRSENRPKKSPKVRYGRYGK